MVTKLVGVLNLTPDSLSDGGEIKTVDHITSRLDEMVKCGINIVDIGAESTRPGATVISDDEEINRLSLLDKQLIDYIHNLGLRISLDSRNALAIKKYLDLGIDIVNDVSGCVDAEICRMASEYKCDLVFMHNLGIPADKTKLVPDDVNLIELLTNWCRDKVSILVNDYGIAKEKIIFDPGIGFGKHAMQSFEIIANVDKFNALGVPLYLGYSRKSLFKHFSQKTHKEYDFDTALVTMFSTIKKVDYLRVHNFSMNSLAVKMADLLIDLEK